MRCLENRLSWISAPTHFQKSKAMYLCCIILLNLGSESSKLTLPTIFLLWKSRLREKVCAQANVALIVMFNYFYTFQQLDPKELSEQLKRQGGSIQGVRPGRKTAEYITNTLNRMSLLGSGFLGLLAAAPAGVEAITKLQVLPPNTQQDLI